MATEADHFQDNTDTLAPSSEGNKTPSLPSSELGSHSKQEDPEKAALPTKPQQQQTPSPVEAAAKPTANDAAAIPDGGFQAWLQVACGFMLFFNTWGLLNTFGVFQTYYESGQLFSESSSNISWIGAIQTFCLLCVGFITGPVFDRGYLKTLLGIGTFGVVFGFMMLSLSKTFWECLLAQGFCVGIGCGCLFVPGVAILPTYFRRKLGLAIGLAASGSSTGGIIYPIVFYRLVNQIGFGWSVRVLGFLALGTLLLPISCMKMRVKPLRARALIDQTVFTDWPFITFIIGTVIGFIGIYVMLFYISYFGLEQKITNASLSFYLVPILNAASIFGRTLPNALSDKVGPLNLIIPGALICGIINFCMISVHDLGGIVVSALAFGFFSGVFIGLPPVCFAMLTKDKTKVGTRMGMGFSFIAGSVLAGAPGSGDILQNYTKDLNWTGIWLYGGISNVVAAAVFLALRIWKAGSKLNVKI
ncbi:putative mfs monocarboxylate [Phaeomoniella chlamydospora]|uniref:Putative mfs monocarboxylate n=1 Tax=Phaeomoniella chlamydospora TaxID=158046 RepID=A0A0G2E736_PHACM|nr:putative mfs monocarboxylate [Phaeomoniella chlamydospora]